MRKTLLLVVIAACGGNGNKPDASPDAPSTMAFQGEYVDWDSTDGPDFCGILGATLTAHDDPSLTDPVNAPNGRLMLTMPITDTRLDITPPTDPSECMSMPGTYENPGILIVDPALVAKQIDYSIRNFTTTRRTSFFTSLGLTYDDTKAQVFVNVQGTATNPTITGTHAASAAFDGATWAAGGQGVYVFFPNVDPSAGSTMVTATGATGSQTLPLVAGTISYAAVSN